MIGGPGANPGGAGSVRALHDQVVRERQVRRGRHRPTHVALRDRAAEAQIAQPIGRKREATARQERDRSADAFRRG